LHAHDFILCGLLELGPVDNHGLMLKLQKGGRNGS